MLQIFNTLSRKIEEFEPINKKKVKMYTCGPTVYNYVHIGNLRAYVFADLLRRYLNYLGFQVKHVMNITDVDDKTIKNSQKEDKKLKDFTSFYFNAFVKDLNSLNIELPDIVPMATGHIQEMVNLIKILEKKGFAYKANDSIYFNIAKFPDYGRLALLGKQKLKKNAAARLNIEDEYEKEAVNDFVLWKDWKPEDGKNFWETEIGKGRPGWHIECSAMSMKYLGKSFDIHTGGVDLIFPHHTNEIAQSEAATAKKFVNYWLHNEHLIVGGEKMSKSLGNYITLLDLVKKGYNPLLIRLTLLRIHYRQILNFTFDVVEESRKIAEKLINFLIDIDQIERRENNGVDIDDIINKNRKEFIAAMNNDLNISIAFKVIFSFVALINKNIKDLNIDQAKIIKKYIYEVDTVFGFIIIFYDNYQNKVAKLANDISIINFLKQRNALRKEKRYLEADKIRTSLLRKGIMINDTEQGQQLRLKEVI